MRFAEGSWRTSGAFDIEARGRDFGVMLACLRDEDYTVEWRILNAADYGYQQRRRRVFIFAYKNGTRYADEIKAAVSYHCDAEIRNKKESISALLGEDGFFAKTFPVRALEAEKIKRNRLPDGVGQVSASFSFPFENTGVMLDGEIYTVKSAPVYDGPRKTLGDVMDEKEVEETYFIADGSLYYTHPDITRSDETITPLTKEQRHTWQYIKGGKKLLRKSANGHEYVYSEGPIPMIDDSDKPARTMLTSEGAFSRTTHIVKDKKTGKIRLLTANETERIQGFPADYTRRCLTGGGVAEMPLHKRRFMMGNALAVDLIKRMEPLLDQIISGEE